MRKLLIVCVLSMSLGTSGCIGYGLYGGYLAASALATAATVAVVGGSMYYLLNADRVNARYVVWRDGDQADMQQASVSRKSVPMNSYTKKVAKAQIALEDMGYEVGGVDGIMGTKTSMAIMKFQQDQKLEVTGNLDDFMGQFPELEKI